MFDKNQSLITDLYQMTMAAAYWENNIDYTSTFELFIRKLPENRSYLVACGIDHCIDYLLNLKFNDDEISYLQQHQNFKKVSGSFFAYLKDFRFTGDVWALEEGTLFFPNEPVIRVTAPLIQAQIVETYLLSMFNFQTLIASKAARIVEAAQGRKVIEFGTRRAHSPVAGTLAARAAYVGGCAGTSNVLAGMKFNIPIFGTMAHSWIMSFESEEEAFRSYSDIFPDANVLLIDTYDTINAANIVAGLPFNVSGIRLDSGNMEYLSKQVRDILDKSGKTNTSILASGDLNEYSITKLINQGSPIDIFGVGTELATSKDCPSLGGVYKLVEQLIANKIIYKAKFSENKISYPAKKQVYRYLNDNESFSYDIIACENELETENNIKMLKLAINKGKLMPNFTRNISIARDNCLNSLKKLPKEIKLINSPSCYNVRVSPTIIKLVEDIKAQRLTYA